MAGVTRHPFISMFRLLPVDELLVMPFGKFVGVDMFDIAALERSGFVIGFQGLAGLVTHRPAGALFHSGFAAVVAGPADLNSHTHGQLGRIDNGLALFKDGGLGQSGMPGAFAVTGLAGDARFYKGVFLQIHTGGMTTAALQQPGPFVPVFLVVIDPAMGIRVVLDGRDKQGVIFF